MIQSLHILRKDVRHLWADLTVYAALLIAISVVIPDIWKGAAVSNPLLANFASLLKALIPIIWLVMIARLIHDEALVGDRQFWITRPYTWNSLLSAKLLFIVLCLVLPFAMMQWALLLHAGLNPLYAIHGQLLTLLYIALWVWLPFTAVAAVTSTVQRMFMSMLVAVIFWAGVLTILGGSAGMRMSPPFAALTLSILSGGLLTGVLLYQYVSRNTLRSRIALAAIAVLFVGLFWCFVEAEIPGPVDILIRHHYPVSTNKSLRLAFDSHSRPSQDAEEGEIRTGTLVDVRLPVSIQGLDPSDRLDNQNASFTIDAPGYHYRSPWRPLSVDDEDRLQFILFIPQKVLNQVHASDVRLHLSVVARRLVPGTPEIVTAADQFSVPGDGNCQLLPNRSGDNLLCRYSFQRLLPTTIKASVTNAPCDSSGPRHPGIEMFGSYPAGTRVDPINFEPGRLGGTVCPGTQITFFDYHPADNFRLELDIPAISLDQYITR